MFANTKAFSGFAVDDLDKAREFYGETLGLETTSEENGLLTLHLAGDRPTLVYPKPDYTPADLHDPQLPRGRHRRRRSTSWPRGACVRALRRLRPGREGHLPRRGPAIAWFKDPAGNVLSVLETD